MPANENDHKAFPKTAAKQPEGMVIYDPEKPSSQRLHVCVLLRKVNDSLHGDDPGPGTSGEDDPYP